MFDSVNSVMKILGEKCYTDKAVIIAVGCMCVLFAKRRR